MNPLSIGPKEVDLPTMTRLNTGIIYGVRIVESFGPFPKRKVP